MGILHNNERYRVTRQSLRGGISSVEAKLWIFLKGRGLLGLKFRRQHGIGPYIVDYYCPELRLAIEIDGDSHCTPQAIIHDSKRTDYLIKCNVTVIRFTNREVLDSLCDVVESIKGTVIKMRQDTTPNPSL